MALCINQSGTWRNATTLCANQSGTWRKITTGCINQSGTWRKFGFQPTTLGASFGGGYAICMSSGVVWIVAPNTTEVSVTTPNQTDAVTNAQSVSGCTGWFIPTLSQLQNPGYTCRTYWDSYSCDRYWSSTQAGPGFYAWTVNFANGTDVRDGQGLPRCARAFRCVTY